MLGFTQESLPGHKYSGEEQKAGLERSADATHRFPFCTSEFWGVILEFASASNPAFIRPMRIILYVFYVYMFNSKCLMICYRHISCKGLSLSRALDVPGNQ